MKNLKTKKYVLLGILALSLVYNCTKDEDFVEEETSNLVSKNENDLLSEIDEELSNFIDFENLIFTPESEIIKKRKERESAEAKNTGSFKRLIAPMSQARSGSRPKAFNSDTFIREANEKFSESTRNIIMSGQDLMNYDIIDQNTLNAINSKTNDNDEVHYYNQKFTQAASNLIYGHHKNNNNPRKIIRVVSLLVKNIKGKDVVVKIYEGEKKYVDKAAKPEGKHRNYLYWNVREVNKLNEVITKNENRYPDANFIHQSKVPSYVFTKLNANPTMKTAQEIFGHKDNTFTTLDINEAYTYSKGREITNQIGVGIDVSFKPLGVVLPTLDVTLSFDYSRTWSRSHTSEWLNQVNSEVVFTVPNDRVPANYSYRLHPTVGFSSTELSFDMVAQPSGGLRTFNRTSLHHSTDRWRQDENIVKPLIANYKLIWNLFWNQGIVFKYDKGFKNDGLYDKKTEMDFVYRDLDGVEEVKTGIEIYKNGSTADEANIFIRRDVPFKTDINRAFVFTQDKIISAAEEIQFLTEDHPYTKDMTVGQDGDLVLRLFSGFIPPKSHSYVVLRDVNRRAALYQIDKSEIKLNDEIIIDLSSPILTNPGFQLFNVKSFVLNISDNLNEEITFSAYIR